MYRLIRPVLFLFDPETIHHFIFALLKSLGRVPGFHGLCRIFFDHQQPSLEKKLLGLTFKNRVGLAAGFDKNAVLIDEMASFGFGCIEIGTLTPKPQHGNDRPRLFRLPVDKAIINRMGFNNHGIDAAVSLLKKRKSSVIVGGNIGKNKTTANENAFEDYMICIRALHAEVDYFVVNVSSPNTPNLRELQEKEPLKKILTQVKLAVAETGTARPVLLKIAPDLTITQLDEIVEILLETKTDGVIATNTTVSRETLATPRQLVDDIGAGGLSGMPLQDRSNEVIAYLRKKLGSDYPIIGVGGIMTPEDALQKIRAGADLIQLYTGFVYQGPAIVRRINKFLAKNL